MELLYSYKNMGVKCPLGPKCLKAVLRKLLGPRKDTMSCVGYYVRTVTWLG
jgi:hypothetical protein